MLLYPRPPPCLLSLLPRSAFLRIIRLSLPRPSSKFAPFATNTTTMEAMDPVQKRLMFDDECILVDENDCVVGHDSKYNCVKNAAQRKLYDELGIAAEDAPIDEFTCLGRILYKAPSNDKWGEHELDYLLFLVRDVKLNPNPEEVADVLYVNKEQLKELLRKADSGQDGVKLSPWFRLVVDNYLFDWWSKLENKSISDAVNMKDIHKLC